MALSGSATVNEAYKYISAHTHIYIYIYICVERERVAVNTIFGSVLNLASILLGTSWGLLGASWELPGGLLRAFWSLVERLGGALGAS